MVEPFTCSLAGLLGLWIAYEDHKTQTIPLVLLLMFGGLSFFQGVKQPDFLINSVVSIFFLGGLYLYENLRKRNFMGNADKILLLCACAWIPFPQLPSLWILSGSLGIILSFLYKEKSFPFAPAILGSIGILVGII